MTLCDARAAALDLAVSARLDDVRALAARLIAIDSQIPPFGDERAIVNFLVTEVEARGLEACVMGDPARPSLVATLRGGDGPTLGLCAHVDTKPIGESAALWTVEPLVASVRDGRLYGLGATDMKGAIAAMLVAVDAVIATGGSPGDIVLLLVADEEAGGSHGARLIAPELATLDALLIGEPSGWERDWQAIHVVSRGSSCFRIRVRGTQGHSSLSDRLPLINASERMARLLVDMVDELALPASTFTAPGLSATTTLNRGVTVSGGTWFGVVPGTAEFACDLRTVPGMTFDGVRNAIERWLEDRRARDASLDVEVVFEPGLEWVPPSAIPVDDPLVATVQASASRVLGAAPPLGVFPGATDAPWFAEAGIPTLPSFGPGLISVAHGPDEYVSLRSLGEAARMYAHTIANYGLTHRGGEQ
ncbi:MAG: M20/M25/M40 family metallo-hydrolase [Microbacterium sp.]